VVDEDRQQRSGDRQTSGAHLEPAAIRPAHIARRLPDREDRERRQEDSLSYPRSATEAEAVAAGGDLFFPFKPRRDGAVFDGFVSNLAADRFPLEELTVPTLVINARDDTSFAPYRYAARAADRIPAARLVSIEGGGRWFMGDGAEVREAIGAFVREVSRDGPQPLRLRRLSSLAIP
jgi:pimeloyl-ACP methyl ester carboxylesterase